ncbi:sensor histidine kinase [Chondrinema litorale]|uniref:sensor histidine kinase n=1 Tax=Chondrinema litorale TaxID=2994555 RepID=UPI002543D49A|nr:PAS domain-containing sensor histidine kinase [Chondrinema litorale]UZR97816.1 PAS domain-containing sensor histidine kinase [Chondrinema litorale]
MGSKTDLHLVERGDNAELESVEISEDTFKTLVENLPDIVFRYDKNLRAIFINSQGLEQLQIARREDILYKTTLEAGYPESMSIPWMQKIAQVFETGKKQTHNKQYIFNEKVEFFHSILAPEFDTQGKVKSVLTITRNVSELHKTEVELELKNKQLAIKNSELEEFSYVAAHDLKAPLTNLQSLVTLIDNKISNENRSIFDKIKQVVEILTNKLNSFNDVIAIKSNLRVEKESVLFEDVLAEVKFKLKEEIIESDINIRADFSNSPEITYSPSHLHSILYNLLKNAIRFRNLMVKSEVFLSTNICNGKTLLSVKDNGIGFNEEMGTNKIFGLFKRMHTHTDGLGVGLYLVKTIVNSQGGHIEVSSKINLGTEFRIYL